MRLERAFLLDELRKRMEYNVDGSDGSGEEGMATPPPDRPHRDKRRRQQPASSTGPPTSTFQATAYTPSGPGTSEPVGGATTPMPSVHGNQMVHEDARYGQVDPSQQLPSQPAALPHGSPYDPPPTGVPSGPPLGAVNGGSYEDRDGRPVSRQAAATGEPIGAGPTVVEENGERKILSS